MWSAGLCGADGSAATAPSFRYGAGIWAGVELHIIRPGRDDLQQGGHHEPDERLPSCVDS